MRYAQLNTTLKTSPKTSSQLGQQLEGDTLYLRYISL